MGHVIQFNIRISVSQNLITFLVSSPDPTLEEGKRSGELWPNPQFLRYGTHRLAMQSWGPIGQHECVAIALLRSCGKLVIWLCQSCDLIGAFVHIQAMLHSYGKLVMWPYQSWDLIGTWKLLHTEPRIWPKFIGPLSLLEGEVWGKD